MYAAIRLALAGMAMMGLASCDLTTRDFTLRPLLEGVHQTVAATRDGPCVFLQTRGTASPALAQWRRGGGLDRYGMLVGYRSQLRRGADPVPCNEWVFHAAQGKAFFDLSGLPDGALVERAVLRFAVLSDPIIDEGVESAPCRFQLGSAEGLSTAPLVFANGPGGQINMRAIGAPVAGGVLRETVHTVDVSRTVNRWVRQDRSDPWFVFSSADGGAFVEHDEADGIGFCNAYVSDVELQITAQVRAVP